MRGEGPRDLAGLGMVRDKAAEHGAKQGTFWSSLPTRPVCRPPPALGRGPSLGRGSLTDRTTFLMSSMKAFLAETQKFFP